MKRNLIFIITLILISMMFVFNSYAQEADSLAWQHKGDKGQGGEAMLKNQNETSNGTNVGEGKRLGFVDADGDGLNDRDADGDGVPNGQDADFVRGSGQGSGSGDCTGSGSGTGQGSRMHGGKGQGAGGGGGNR